MNWRDIGWYLLPSNGGISLGWLQKHCTIPTTNNDGIGASDTSNGTISTNNADGDNDNNTSDNSSLSSKDDAMVIVVKLSLPLLTGYDINTNDEKQDDKT